MPPPIPFPLPQSEFSAEDLQVLGSRLQVVRFSAGDCILPPEPSASACYLIEEGEVRIEIAGGELDSATALTSLGAGSLLGELGLLDGHPCSFAAYAQGSVVLRMLSAQDLESLMRSHPRIALSVVRALARDTTQKLRTATRRLAERLAADSADPEVDRVVARAAAAQHAFKDWTDQRVDGLLLALATALAEHAQDLARLTVKATRIGNVHDKTRKNTFACLGIYRSLAGKPTQGPLSTDPERKVTEFASPVGVIFAILPITSPVATAVFKTLISLKARNALILSFPRTCPRVADAVGVIIQRVLEANGAPVDLVQWVRERKNRLVTERFMRHKGVALILATGGADMVKAAYSSGTPAIGVGPGNAPALVSADADLDVAAKHIVMSKTSDNGLTCGAEHHLVVDARVRGEFVNALERHGAVVLTGEEADEFRSKVVDRSGKGFRPEIVGQMAQTIAMDTGIKRPYPIRLLIVPTDSISPADPFAGEKLAPILSLFTVHDEEHGIEVCRRLLAHAGAGHTAIVHSRNQGLIERFSNAMPASRILVNTQGSLGCGGMMTGLDPSFSLGCGTFGGNSTTDNITYRHLLNIKRVAHHLESKEQELASAGLLDPCPPCKDTPPWYTDLSA
jgi:acetaldehyde dehydrogenase / alcohol dehydrogenase